MKISRRRALRRLGAGAAAAWAAAACRQRLATRGACAALAGQRVRWIVPNAAGGGYDTEIRALQPFLETQLAAEIVVRNMPGAGGLLGARAIADATPDGLTLGVVGMPGLLIASLLKQTALDPAAAFAVLARISRSAHVWARGSESRFTTLDEVLATGRQRPLVFAINEVGSANFVSISVSAALADVRAALVPGFEGTRAAALAASRGDVDLVCFNFDTLRPLIAAGELVPILQLTDQPIAADPLLANVPCLGGGEGVAVREARRAGKDERTAAESAHALTNVIGSGRVVVGPAGLDSPRRRCLADGVRAAIAASRVSTRDAGAADAVEAIADVRTAAADAARLLPFIEPALATLRG